MSFPKANLKRFNEVAGCAPPVGSYDPKLKGKEHVAAFDKSERFKAPKDVGSTSTIDLSTSCVGTPVKKLFNESVCSNPERSMNGKTKPKPDIQHTQDMAKIKELEREIRKLVQERAIQDKLLMQREEAMKKLEGRLHVAQTDKSSLQAKVASLEKQAGDIKKSNELLKTKVTSLETASDKHSEKVQAELTTLKNQLEIKEKEIIKIQHELDVTMATQLADLQCFESVLKLLEEKLEELGNNRKNENSTGNAISETISAENDCLKNQSNKKTAEAIKKSIILCLKNYDEMVKRKEKTLENKYNDALSEKDEIEQSLTQFREDLQSAVKCSQALQEYRKSLESKNKILKVEAKELVNENWNSRDNIRHLKGEVSAFTDLLFQSDQALFEATAEKAELIEKIEYLEEEKSVLNRNIQSMTEKFHELESLLEQQDKRNHSSKEKLQSQLDLTMENLQQIEKDYQSVQEKNKQLISAINKEKIEVEKLNYELTEEKRIISDLNQLIDDKDDRITDLEIHVEVSKVELQNMKDIADKHLKDIKVLNKQVGELEVIEGNLRKEIQHEKEINEQTVREQADRIFELEHNHIELLDTSRAEIRVLNERVGELEIIEKNLQEEIQHGKEDNQQKVQDQANRIIELEQKQTEILESSCAEIKVLNERVSELELIEKTLHQEIQHEKEIKQQLVKETENKLIEIEQKHTEIQESSCAEIKVLNEQVSELELIEKTLHEEKEKNVQKLRDQTDKILELEQKQEEMLAKSHSETEVLNERIGQMEIIEQNLRQEIQHEREVNQQKIQNQEKIISELEQKRIDVQDSFCAEIKVLNERVSELEIIEQNLLQEIQHEKDRSLQTVQEQADRIFELEQHQTEVLESSRAQIKVLNDRINELEVNEQNLCQKIQHDQDLNQKEKRDQEKTIFELEQKQIEILESSNAEIKVLNERIWELETTEEQLHQDMRDEREKHQQTVEEQLDRIFELEQKQDSSHDAERWQKLYEELHAKVEPFMDQLDAFEAEKQALLGRNQNVEAEIEKMSKEYARLLGHQNQKQKIHHIIKIKDENNALKKEVTSTREQISKQKRTIQKLEEKMASLQGKKKFDPSKAFMNLKENTAPLKEGNRK